jgi:general secretion pathway protein K
MKIERGGFIVVVVLCMVIMLSVLLLGFNYKSCSNLYAVDGFQKSEQALNCARAGLNIAIAAARDTHDFHAQETMLALFSGESIFAVGKGECSIAISGENGKFNVNLLKDKEGKLDRARIEQLLRLIDLLNQNETRPSDIGYGMVPSIIDWTDSDDQITCLPFIKQENTGVESSYYSQLSVPYQCRNGLLETTGELLLVKGITPQVFDCMSDYLTIYGNGKIDINCASKLVLESLSEKMDATLAKLIIDRRRFKFFESIVELKDLPGMTDSIYNSIKNMITVDQADQYYHVTSRANVDHLVRVATAILKRNEKTKSVDVILYKEL